MHEQLQIAKKQLENSLAAYVKLSDRSLKAAILSNEQELQRAKWTIEDYSDKFNLSQKQLEEEREKTTKLRTILVKNGIDPEEHHSNHSLDIEQIFPNLPVVSVKEKSIPDDAKEKSIIDDVPSSVGDSSSIDHHSLSSVGDSSSISDDSLSIHGEKNKDATPGPRELGTINDSPSLLHKLAADGNSNGLLDISPISKAQSITHNSKPSKSNGRSVLGGLTKAWNIVIRSPKTKKSFNVSFLTTQELTEAAENQKVGGAPDGLVGGTMPNTMEPDYVPEGFVPISSSTHHSESRAKPFTFVQSIWFAKAIRRHGYGKAGGTRWGDVNNYMVKNCPEYHTTEARTLAARLPTLKMFAEREKGDARVQKHCKYLMEKPVPVLKGKKTVLPNASQAPVELLTKPGTVGAQKVQKYALRKRN